MGFHRGATSYRFFGGTDSLTNTSLDPPTALVDDGGKIEPTLHSPAGDFRGCLFMVN